MSRARTQSRFVRCCAVLALAWALATGCRSQGRIGSDCDASACKKPVDCAAGSCSSPPPPCQGAACEPDPPPVCTPDRCDPGCDPASCVPPPACEGMSCPTDACPNGNCELDACADGGCDEVDACAGGACAAPSCDGGICQAGVCDGGACEPQLGCNTTFPICARCQNDRDCDDDREESRCDTTRGRCVECLINAHCVSPEPFCIEGDCEECVDDDDCPGALRCRSGDCGID